MKKVFTISFFVLVGICGLRVNGQIVSARPAFFKRLTGMGMSFILRNSYKEVEVDTSISMKYDYAITDPGGLCEIRYKIMEMPENITKERTPLFFRTIMTALGLNIAYPSPYKYEDFPADAVKNDFNADMGGQFYLKDPKPEFTRKSNIYIITYCKTGKAMIVVFYLFNNFEQPAFGKIVQDTYKAIKFIDSSSNKPGPFTDSLVNISADNIVLKNALDATDEQVRNVLSIYATYKLEMEKLRDEASVKGTERFKKIVSLGKQKDDELKKILNQEQFVKWKNIEKKIVSNRLAPSSN